MVTVKLLKPYYVKTDSQYVRVVLAYQYFAVIINQQVYQFVPIESEEIRIDRRTQKIENVEARFAFQKGKDLIYLNMTDLTSLPDFLVQLHTIAQPYYIEQKKIPEIADTAVIDELERMNIKRMIDKALDNRDKDAFHTLVSLL